MLNATITCPVRQRFWQTLHWRITGTEFSASMCLMETGVVASNATHRITTAVTRTDNNSCAATTDSARHVKVTRIAPKPTSIEVNVLPKTVSDAIRPTTQAVKTPWPPSAVRI